jgi:hypothetical protein
MAQINEKDRRRPTFSDGSAVQLADGQLWTFPRPKVQFRPRIVDGHAEVMGGSRFGAEFDSDLDILLGVVDAEPVDRLRAKFQMAVRLLLSNYALSDEEISNLIVWEPECPVSAKNWTDLTTVLAGGAPPKQSADTSESLA